MMRRAKFRIKLMAGVGVLAAAFLAAPQGAYAATTHSSTSAVAKVSGPVHSPGASAGTAAAKATPARTAIVYASARASAARASAAQSAYTQVCTTGGACLNAWNGGPWVYDGAENVGNNGDFGIQFVYDMCNDSDTTTANCPYSGVPAGHVIFEMIYLGSGPWNGECVGDAYNNQGYADTSLDPCGNLYGGGGAGWGTIHWSDPSGCPSGYSLYISVHWHGGLTVNQSSYGNVWYNNANPSLCMRSGPQFTVT